MKSKDEVTLDTLRTLIDVAESLLAQSQEHRAVVLSAELDERRRELAESFELASPL